MHVLLNLLRNAAQATAKHGLIAVRSRHEGDWAVIEVEDSGRGMTQGILDQLFTPFFTTKGKAGMGLGLRLAKLTVQSWGGSLACASQTGQGACFRICLPNAD